ncbi:glycosyltransferase family 2 protein [Desulfomarina sp.]
MDEKPIASFVVSTYNRASDLERCIDSILAQQCHSPIEILIIDDASTDHTVEMIRKKFGNLVKLICRETNCGSIKNRNYGASLSAGEIVFIVDDDSELPGIHTVEEVLQRFNDQRIGAVTIPFIQNGNLINGHPRGKNGSEIFIVASFIGCACAVRRDTFLNLGGFDEFFHHQVEEDDFCIRLLESGKVCAIANISEPMRHYESPARSFQKWDFYGRRNSLLYIWKNCPASYLLPNLSINTLRGILHAFKKKRYLWNIKGILDGYGVIFSSFFNSNQLRHPVRKSVYNIIRQMRNRGPLPISSLDHIIKETLKK